MNNSIPSNSKKTVVSPKKIAALFNLLEDNDPKIYIPAMGEIVKLGNSNIEAAIADHQESDNKKLRSRVHQIESILTKNRNIQVFVDSIKDDKCDAWKGALFIESIFNKDFSPFRLLKQINELCEHIIKANITSIDLAEALHKLNFRPNTEDILAPTSFSLESCLTYRSAHNIILAIFARQFARNFGLNLHIILNKGRHCLIDLQRNIIDPQLNWQCRTLEEDEKVYSCSDREILLTYCNKLYLSFLNEGHLRPIHKMSQILSSIADIDLSELPFPIGNDK